MSQQHVGTVTAVNGPVLDIKFADGTLPNLMNAIEVKMADKKIVAEVAQHLGALHRNELDRRYGPRHQGCGYRCADLGAGWQRDPGPDLQCTG